jgi:hypothetical protein
MLLEAKGLFSSGFLIFITYAVMGADRKFSKEGSKGSQISKKEEQPEKLLQNLPSRTLRCFHWTP